MVAPEPQPTEQIVISTIGIFSSTIDGSSEVKGVAPI